MPSFHYEEKYPGRLRNFPQGHLNQLGHSQAGTKVPKLTVPGSFALLVSVIKNKSEKQWFFSP